MDKLLERYDAPLTGAIIVSAAVGFYGVWWALAAYLGGAL
jgi:hypothetical protein